MVRNHAARFGPVRVPACLLAFIAAVAPAAGAPPDAPGPQTTPGAPAAPEPASPSRPGPVTTAEVEEMARALTPAVEQLRGLAFKSPVSVKVVGDAEARLHFGRRAAKLWPETRARAEQTVFAHLGLLPAGTDLLGALLDVLEEQAGGYYDPDTKTFYVLQDMPRLAAPIIMVHELTHALDDQHFAIDAPRGRPLAEADEDATLAYGAVVEGSGTLVMSLHIVREMQAGRLSPQMLLEFQQSEAGRADRLKAAPAYLQRALLAPYILGQMFLVRGNLPALAQGVPTGDIDRAFRDPPASSEQVLHPEKYWDPQARDLPRSLELPDLCGRLGEGWSLEASGSLGELDVAVLTGGSAPDPADPATLSLAAWTNPGASGWGGDLWHLYKHGDRRATVMATVWDTEGDAAEFEGALTPVKGRRSWRRGPAVVLVAGDAGESGETLAGAWLDALSPPAGAR